jgi:hypothetical protein
MNKSASIALCAFGCVLSGAAAGQEIDASAPMVCAAMELFECDAGGVGCRAVTAESINAPRFIRIDTKKGEITSSRRTDPMKVAKPQSAGGKVLYQGVIGLEQSDNHGLAWSLSIDEASGNMVLSAAGDDAAFVIFGACTGA